MIFRRRVICFFCIVIWGALSAAPARAETVPVTCVVQSDAISASVSLTNTLKTDASCIATCKFATDVYDDNPQIICSGPVPAGREVELCILHSGKNKLARLLEGSADCRKF
jgi:hypothetical protein